MKNAWLLHNVVHHLGGSPTLFCWWGDGDVMEVQPTDPEYWWIDGLRWFYVMIWYDGFIGLYHCFISLYNVFNHYMMAVYYISWYHVMVTLLDLENQLHCPRETMSWVFHFYININPRVCCWLDHEYNRCYQLSCDNKY